METVIMHCTHSAGTRSDFTHIVDENMCIAADRKGIWVYICGMREGGVVNAPTPPSSSSSSLLYPFMHGRYETKMHRNGDDDIYFAVVVVVVFDSGRSVWWVGKSGRQRSLMNWWSIYCMVGFDLECMEFVEMCGENCRYSHWITVVKPVFASYK